MAKEKKSVLLYCDLIHTIEKMDDETAGKFFKHYLRYINDEDPTTDNLIVDLTFESVKQNLKRDLKKWEVSKEERSINGRKGNLKRYHKDLYKQLLEGVKTLEEAESIAFSRKGSHSEVSDRQLSNPVANLAVTVNDTVTVTDINKNNMSSDKKPTTDVFDFNKLLDLINSSQKRKGKDRFTVINKSTKNKFKARIKDGYTKDVIKTAIINASNDSYHKEQNYKYLKPEYFSRSSSLDLHGFKTVASKSNVSKENFVTNPYI